MVIISPALNWGVFAGTARHNPDEAKAPTGELFGFERAAAIRTQSAEAIASAAQTYGQEDDITVLTLTFVRREVIAG